MRRPTALAALPYALMRSARPRCRLSPPQSKMLDLAVAGNKMPADLLEQQQEDNEDADLAPNPGTPLRKPSSGKEEGGCAPRDPRVPCSAACAGFAPLLKPYVWVGYHQSASFPALIYTRSCVCVFVCSGEAYIARFWSLLFFLRANDICVWPVRAAVLTPGQDLACTFAHTATHRPSLNDESKSNSFPRFFFRMQAPLQFAIRFCWCGTPNTLRVFAFF